MLTRSNIAYNLKNSPHEHKIEYQNTTVVYVFSSDLYRKKFIERLDENREALTQSLTKRFNMYVRNDLLFDVRLYAAIEKRGFYILVDSEEFTCQSNIIFVGGKATPRN